MSTPSTEAFHQYESAARSYCRDFPALFCTAKDSILYDEFGQPYIDFLSGAGALNYGHNNEVAKQALLNYIKDDGIVMSLDLHSSAKKRFIECFQGCILQPRGLVYRMQFTSPSGTSVVESAVKLARKITGRQNVVAFTNAFHGMTGVSLSLTGNRRNRQAVGNGQVTRLPYDGYLGEGVDTTILLEKLLDDPSSGVDLPAAVIIETVQGEGGLNVASVDWLRSLRRLTLKFGIPLIVDEIQTGCGRTGKFFSFERADICPDLVCLSKSIGGIGQPMGLLLISPGLDQWAPGEDNGTFRGNNFAFVAAAEVIERYWTDDNLTRDVARKALTLTGALRAMAARFPRKLAGTKGLGFMQGLEFREVCDASDIVKACFENGLVVETCGPRAHVLKIMPALTITDDVLAQGLSIIEEALQGHMSSRATTVHAEQFASVT